MGSAFLNLETFFIYENHMAGTLPLSSERVLTTSRGHQVARVA
jgi:hypothetical protein